MLLTEKLPDAFGRPQAERKSVDDYTKNDPNKAKEQLEKSKNFAIQMMLAEAKRVDPFDESGGSNKSNQMLETANLIAQLDSAMIQVEKMDEMINSIKNPGFDALQLQGKEISYDNSERVFDGKTAVKFDYSLTYANEHEGINLSTDIEIKDKNGKVVYTGRGAYKAGDHSFIWDGVDNNGNKLPSSSYNIEVSSTGRKIENGKQISVPVHANSMISAKVKSVEVEKGAVTKLVLENGKVINKDQVKSIQDIKEPTSAVKLSPKFIGKNVELDLSRVQVINGNMDVYFNNHVTNPGKMIVKVYDEKDKLVKTLQSQEVKEAGSGKLSFKTELESGNYKVKITVEDNDDVNLVATELNSLMNTTIIGINYINQTFITIDDRQFKPHNINAAVTKFTNSIEERAAEYQGAKVEYNDTEFIFKTDKFEPEVVVMAPKEEGDVVLYEIIRIFNNHDELVAEMIGNYTPYTQLDKASKALLPLNIKLRVNRNYNNAEDKRAEDIRFIEEKLSDKTYKFADNKLNELFEQGNRQLKFAKWDGTFGQLAPPDLRGKKANDGDVFRYEHSTMYTRKDGTSYPGNLIIDRNISTVDSVDKENNELFLNLKNGKRINENQVFGLSN